jgi:hypothetical protein
VTIWAQDAQVAQTVVISTAIHVVQLQRYWLAVPADPAQTHQNIPHRPTARDSISQLLDRVATPDHSITVGAPTDIWLEQLAFLGRVDVPQHEHGHRHHLPSAAPRQVVYESTRSIVIEMMN